MASALLPSRSSGAARAGRQWLRQQPGLRFALGSGIESPLQADAPVTVPQRRSVVHHMQGGLACHDIPRVSFQGRFKALRIDLLHFGRVNGAVWRKRQY